MSRNKLGLLLAAATLIGAGVFGACSSSGGGNVALNARTGSTAAMDDGGTAPGVDLGNGISLDRVRIVIRKLEMDQAGSQAADGGFPPGDGGWHREHVVVMHDDGGMKLDGGLGDRDGGHGDVVRGPFLVDLSGAPLAGGIHEAFDTSAPVGTYDEVCFVVNTVSATMASADPGIAAMQALHASIVADGTIDGESFEFTTPFEVAQCRKGSFTVGTGTTNLTFDVDYHGWFTGQDGGRLDPRQSSDRGEILANIRCSIRIFLDGDKDGHPDDGDEGDDDEGRGGCPPRAMPDGGKPGCGKPDGGRADAALPDGGDDGGLPDGGSAG
jgi:hypothetical protein